jgi:hypothetical protein
MKKYTVRRIEKRFVDYLVEANSDIEAWEIVDSFDEGKILKEELMTDDMPIDEAEVGAVEIIDHEQVARIRREMWGN